MLPRPNTQTAHKQVLTTPTMQALRFYCSNAHTVSELETNPSSKDLEEVPPPWIFKPSYDLRTQQPKILMRTCPKMSIKNFTFLTTLCMSENAISELWVRLVGLCWSQNLRMYILTKRILVWIFNSYVLALMKIHKITNFETT